MKKDNHTRIQDILYDMTEQTGGDGRGITLNRLEEICELLANCGCVDACAELLPSFNLALDFAKQKQWQMAGTTLTVACERITLLEIANAS